MIAQSGSAEVESETLSVHHRAGETAWLALRLSDGIDLREFETETSMSARTLFAEPIARHSAAGHLLVTDEVIRIPLGGLLLTDLIAADFLNAAIDSDPTAHPRKSGLPILG